MAAAVATERGERETGPAPAQATTRSARHRRTERHRKQARLACH
jgi:hypothetical protein